MNIIKNFAATFKIGRKLYVKIYNKNIVFTFKSGHPFRFINRLLYNIKNNLIKRLIIFKKLIREILYKIYNKKHYFGKYRIIINFKGVTFRKKLKIIF